MSTKRGIVWFRNDLRLHDNESLCEAINSSDEVICIYVFDARSFQNNTSFGFPKTGVQRAQFLLESVADLKQNLQKLGSDLYIRIGHPEQVVFQLAQQVKSSWVFCNRERTQEEVNVQGSLEKKLWTIGQELRFFRGKMMLHTADLPFPVTQTPDTFTVFRKEVESFVSVREPLPVPQLLKPVRSIRMDWGVLPHLQDLNGSYELIPNPSDHHQFKGGESEALNRLNYYLWESRLLLNYKETRNELLGGDYSSKFSPFLALGCLSPKLVYAEIKRFEAEIGSNESTYWLFFELLWRDFFRFMGKKHGNKIFQLSGTRGTEVKFKGEDWDVIHRWINGNTGIPFVDANMKELKMTGFMSNRGRQNVASYLINDLKQNWLIGAEYFESMLIDYDPCSNYGNWNYLAGVGSDPRQDRYFNVVSQAKRYDPEGDYVKFWIPQLRALPSSDVHEPLLKKKSNPDHDIYDSITYLSDWKELV